MFEKLGRLYAYSYKNYPKYLLQKKAGIPKASQPTRPWRRGRDLNPRNHKVVKRFSRPPHSAALPPLQRYRSGVRTGRRRKLWRRVRDLNPGDALDVYTISNRAPSTARTTLQIKCIGEYNVRVLFVHATMRYLAKKVTRNQTIFTRQFLSVLVDKSTHRVPAIEHQLP